MRERDGRAKTIEFSFHIYQIQRYFFVLYLDEGNQEEIAKQLVISSVSISIVIKVFILFIILFKNNKGAGLGGKGSKKRDGQIGPVNSFPPRGCPLTNKIVWR